LRDIRHRAAPIEVAAEHPTLLAKMELLRKSPTVANSIPSWTATSVAEIDSVYIVFNEFKSVISQRVVVEKLLPIRKLGSHAGNGSSKR
jgi:F-type H+-transporting ATPase subunit gamma